MRSALGFLMFCVGINTKVEQFQQVAREPQVSNCLLGDTGRRV